MAFIGNIFSGYAAGQIGKYNQEEAIDMIKQNTRRFAKRQISWFKRDQTITYFSTSKTKEIIRFIG